MSESVRYPLSEKVNQKSGDNTDVIKTDIRIKLTPRASRDEIIGKETGAFKLKLTAPPVEGKANKALQQFLAKKLGVPKRDIQIVSGHRSRVKLIRIHGLSYEDVNGMLKV